MEQNANFQIGIPLFSLTDTRFRLSGAYWSFRYKSIDDIKIHDDFPL